jgi:hypothetical protein
MNVMDRSFSAKADKETTKLQATRKRRWRTAIGVVIVVVAALVYYIWATTLCGDCGAPVTLPPPPS